MNNKHIISIFGYIDTSNINSSSGGCNNPVSAKFAHFDFLHVSDSLHLGSHSSIEITVICQVIDDIFVVKHSCKCSFVEASRATTL